MLPLSKARAAQFSALRERKYRYQNRQFVVEGHKLTQEALASGFPVLGVVVRGQTPPPAGDFPLFQADEATFAKLSTLEQPEGVLAQIGFPENRPFCGPAPDGLPAGGFVLDGVQDPGNLGTILRIADWFGLGAVVLGPGCVDPLNAKTLRASMGAIFRVPIYTVADLAAWLAAQPGPCWRADMEGERLGQAPLSAQDWVVLGNEANGISPQLRALETLKPLTIPRFGAAESLNVSIAAGILAWEIKNNNQ